MRKNNSKISQVTQEQHITESQFINILKKRLDEYFIAIMGINGTGPRAMAIKLGQLKNIERVQSQLRESNLYSGDFWGYGINSICDGKEVHSNVDVEYFKRGQDLNKHRSDQRFFWLLTFKVDKKSLFVSTFCIDTATYGVVSTLNSKYEFKDFKNARIKTRGDFIYVDLIFENLERPIQFQIDTYAQGGKLSGGPLAQYYINQIEHKAQDVKSSFKIREEKTADIKLLEKEIDEIEKKLRSLFVRILVEKTGKEDYEDILTGKHKSDLKRRIKQHVEKHPKYTDSDFKLFSKSIVFSDINHLKDSILKEDNWSAFEPIFKTKDAADKYFHQLSELRHTVKHSREITKLVKLEGEAAIEWFKQVFFSIEKV